MNFLRLNHFLKLINNFRKKKNTQSAMWQPPGVLCVMLTSARGQPYANVIMIFDDISVDSVNIDQVNDQLGPRPGSAGPICRSQCVTDRRDPHVSSRLKKKEKGKGLQRLTGSKRYWAGL